MKKQTHLHLGGPEGQQIFSIVTFKGELFFKCKQEHICIHVPDRWFALDGWSMICRKCQSSHNPLALIAVLSSRFKFTSPRIRPAYIMCTVSSMHVSQWADLCYAVENVPATVLEAGRACRAMSGWVVLWEWRPGICCSLGVDILCCPPSVVVGGNSKGCWEGTEVGGRCGGLIFSAMSCSLILLISMRLSNWGKKGESEIRTSRWFKSSWFWTTDMMRRTCV